MPGPDRVIEAALPVAADGGPGMTERPHIVPPVPGPPPTRDPAPRSAGGLLDTIPGAGTAPDDRAWVFLNQQYRLLAERVTMLQQEREQWIRLSVLATFGFFGWIAQYAEEAAMSLMLGTTELRLIYIFPFIFNAGGALRFYFIQRDINRISRRQMTMETGPLGIPARALPRRRRGPACATGTGHAPSIAYWGVILLLCAGVGLVLVFDIGGF